VGEHGPYKADIPRTDACFGDIGEGAVPTVELSDRFCDRTKPTDKRVDYFDSKTTGLMLRVSSTGVRSFAVLFGPEKKRVLMTLCRYPRLSSHAPARSLARTLATPRQ
jgi:Arm DNA-binding domain